MTGRAHTRPVFFMKYIAILFSLFIIGIVILADRNTLPPFVRAFYDFPYGDKAGHLTLFGLLNFFITVAFLRALPNRTSSRVALSAGLILALFVAVEEFSQRYFSARTFDLLDLTASIVGLIIGGWIALRLKK